MSPSMPKIARMLFLLNVSCRCLATTPEPRSSKSKGTYTESALSSGLPREPRMTMERSSNAQLSALPMLQSNILGIDMGNNTESQTEFKRSILQEVRISLYMVFSRGSIVEQSCSH